MWDKIFEYFVEGLVAAFAAFVLLWFLKPAKRKNFGQTILICLMIALVSSVPQILFGYFPQLHKGWIGFFVGIGIVLIIALPFAFWIPRLTQKK